MEKFALLNLLKAIDGLKSISAEQNAPSAPTPPPKPAATAQTENALPNIMYEALMRHETVSNRIRNRK